MRVVAGLDFPELEQDYEFVALAAGAPQNVVAPAITGQFVVGNVITVSSGTWSGSPTKFAYRWTPCDATGGPCGAVAQRAEP